MRLIDGSTFPLIVLIGWLFAFIAISLIFMRRRNLSTQEMSNLAALGAFVFIIQSLFIFPVPGSAVPIMFSITGITLVITIAGPTRGIIIGSSAMILNHLFIPGSLSMLGINLSNMIIISLLMGWFPSKVYYNPYVGRRIRYTVTFIAGFSYVILETIIISLEVVFFYESNINFLGFFYGFLVFGIVLGLIEGAFTAISASYYHRTIIVRTQQRVQSIIPIDDDSDIEKIQFNVAESIFQIKTRRGRKRKFILQDIEKIDFDLSFLQADDGSDETHAPDLT